MELVIAVELLDSARSWVADVASSEALQPLPGFFTDTGIAGDGLELLYLSGPPNNVVSHIHSGRLWVTLFPLSSFS